MTETSSPTVWRRWLAFELVRLRKEAGLEQKDVAKALRCTVAKVSYYETSERPVVLRDLDEVLLPLYNVPEDRWDDYLRAARNARQKGWWEGSDGTSMPRWFSLFVGLEQGASQVRAYESEAVPGLLQTKAYADAITRRGTAERRDDEVDRLVDLRMTRQAALSRESNPLRLWTVLNEAVLRRVVGSPAIMRDQLLHLVEMTRHPKITVQVLPYGHGAHPGMAAGPFQLLGFPWPADPGVAYVEHRAGACYLERDHEIEAHTVAFEHLVALALSPESSVAVVREIAKEYE